MNWKKKLNGYEENGNWDLALNLVTEELRTSPENVELYIRTIYLMHNIVLEVRSEVWKAQKLDHDFIADRLKEIFDIANRKFSENAEYLFFIGIITHIAEWYFGYNDIKPALEMQKKAYLLEPHNKLYKWSYYYSNRMHNQSEILAKAILDDENINSWLQSQGLPGSYVLMFLKADINGKNQHRH